MFVIRSVADTMIPKGATLLKTGEIVFPIGFHPDAMAGYTKVKEAVFTPILKDCSKREYYETLQPSCCPPIKRMKCDGNNIQPIDCQNCKFVEQPKEIDFIGPLDDEDYYGP